MAVLLPARRKLLQRTVMATEDKDIHEAQGTPETEEQVTPEVVDERSDLEIAQEDLQGEKDQFLRLFAEFENYKKRTTKERMDLYRTAGQEVLQSMLPVLDDFDRAMPEIEKAKNKELTTGIKLISNKLRETLKSKGLEVMEVRAGDAFNPDRHEAITQIPAPDKSLKGKIVDVIEKGYTLGDKIIRFPKVVTGQ